MLPEPSAPEPTTRLEWLLRLSIQIRGLTAGQFPNASLALWLVASAVAWGTDGTAKDIAEVVAVVGLLWWAGDEVLRGVNWFRRSLGAVVLAVTVVGLVA